MSTTRAAQFTLPATPRQWLETPQEMSRANRDRVAQSLKADEFSAEERLQAQAAMSQRLAAARRPAGDPYRPLVVGSALALLAALLLLLCLSPRTQPSRRAARAGQTLPLER
jgi:hypothetical protein